MCNFTSHKNQQKNLSAKSFLPQKKKKKNRLSAVMSTYRIYSIITRKILNWFLGKNQCCALYTRSEKCGIENVVFNIWNVRALAKFFKDGH